MMNPVKVDRLCKAYPKTQALQDISFEVAPGEIFGIIGPDGAGKTTLFRILTTLILADSGEAHINGFNVRTDLSEIRDSVGYMPGRFSLYQDLTVEENLEFFATLFRTSIEENYELIRDIYEQIKPFKDRRAGALSGGMKQKLALSCALIHQPTVLFLDEPTTGVDPVSRKEFWGMLRKLRGKGITILVSTPYMDEAALCDRIALIKEGKFLQVDTPENIIAAYPDRIWAVHTEDMSALLKDLRSMAQIKHSFAFGDVHHVNPDAELIPEELIRMLTQRGHCNVGVEPQTPSIEDCYMAFAQNHD